MNHKPNQPKNRLFGVPLSLQPLPSLRSVQWPPAALLLSLPRFKLQTGTDLNLYNYKYAFQRKPFFFIKESNLVLIKTFCWSYVFLFFFADISVRHFTQENIIMYDKIKIKWNYFYLFSGQAVKYNSPKKGFQHLL